MSAPKTKDIKVKRMAQSRLLFLFTLPRKRNLCISLYLAISWKPLLEVEFSQQLTLSPPFTMKVPAVARLKHILLWLNASDILGI